MKHEHTWRYAAIFGEAPKDKVYICRCGKLKVEAADV